MRNLIVGKFASPPTEKQKETKLKHHLVKRKMIFREKKTLLDNDVVPLKY